MHRRTRLQHAIDLVRSWAARNGKRALPVLAAIVAAAGVSYGVATASSTTATTIVACPDGVDLLVHPGNTWTCGDPQTTPTGSGTPSPSPSTSISPTPSATSTSASPAPSATTSTSPAPSPSTSGPVVTGCAAVPSACGYPDATNTGVRGLLDVVSGNVTLKTAGQVYENKDVRGCITVTAPGVTIRNVKVSCKGNYAVYYHGTGARLTIEDSTVDCGWSAGTAFGDRNVTVRRANISQCANGGDIDTEVTVEDSWIHNLYDVGDPHTDGLQIQATTGSGANIRVIHNTIDLVGADSTGNVFADHCQCTVFEVDRNLLMGDPSIPIYCPTNGTSTGVKVTNNRFAGNGAWGWANGCGRAGYTWTGNIRDSTGKTVNP